MDGPEIGRLPAYIAIPEKGAETDPSMYVRTGAGISWLPRNGWSRRQGGMAVPHGMRVGETVHRYALLQAGLQYRSFA
jgi:hypothetical protein